MLAIIFIRVPWRYFPGESFRTKIVSCLRAQGAAFDVSARSWPKCVLESFETSRTASLKTTVKVFSAVHEMARAYL